MASDREAGATRLGSGTRLGEETVITPAPVPVREESYVREEVTQERPVNVAVGAERRDLVRWGPVWAGLVMALASFLLIELIFFSLGWLTFNQGVPGSTAGLVSGLIGLFAFFLGGLTAGATAMWRGLHSGLLHGLMVWALGLLAFLFLTLFGGGALLGSLGSVAAQVVNLGQVANNVNVPNVQAQQALATARSGASWAVLGLGLSLLASALGGVVGAKIWPRQKDNDPKTVNLR